MDSDGEDGYATCAMCGDEYVDYYDLLGEMDEDYIKCAVKIYRYIRLWIRYEGDGRPQYDLYSNGNCLCVHCHMVVEEDEAWFPSYLQIISNEILSSSTDTSLLSKVEKCKRVIGALENEFTWTQENDTLVAPRVLSTRLMRINGIPTMTMESENGLLPYSKLYPDYKYFRFVCMHVNSKCNANSAYREHNVRSRYEWQIVETLIETVLAEHDTDTCNVCGSGDEHHMGGCETCSKTTCLKCIGIYNSPDSILSAWNDKTRCFNCWYEASKIEKMAYGFALMCAHIPSSTVNKIVTMTKFLNRDYMVVNWFRETYNELIRRDALKLASDTVDLGDGMKEIYVCQLIEYMCRELDSMEYAGIHYNYMRCTQCVYEGRRTMLQYLCERCSGPVCDVYGRGHCDKTLSKFYTQFYGIHKMPEYSSIRLNLSCNDYILCMGCFDHIQVSYKDAIRDLWCQIDRMDQAHVYSDIHNIDDLRKKIVDRSSLEKTIDRCIRFTMDSAQTDILHTKLKSVDPDISRKIEVGGKCQVEYRFGIDYAFVEHACEETEVYMCHSCSNWACEQHAPPYTTLFIKTLLGIPITEIDERDIVGMCINCIKSSVDTYIEQHKMMTYREKAKLWFGIGPGLDSVPFVSSEEMLSIILQGPTDRFMVMSAKALGTQDSTEEEHKHFVDILELLMCKLEYYMFVAFVSPPDCFKGEHMVSDKNKVIEFMFNMTKYLIEIRYDDTWLPTGENSSVSRMYNIFKDMETLDDFSLCDTCFNVIEHKNEMCEMCNSFFNAIDKTKINNGDIYKTLSYNIYKHSFAEQTDRSMRWVLFESADMISKTIRNMSGVTISVETVLTNRYCKFLACESTTFMNEWLIHKYSADEYAVHTLGQNFLKCVKCELQKCKVCFGPSNHTCCICLVKEVGRSSALSLKDVELECSINSNMLQCEREYARLVKDIEDGMQKLFTTRPSESVGLVAYKFDEELDSVRSKMTNVSISWNEDIYKYGDFGQESVMDTFKRMVDSDEIDVEGVLGFWDINNLYIKALEYHEMASMKKEVHDQRQKAWDRYECWCHIHVVADTRLLSEATNVTVPEKSCEDVLSGIDHKTSVMMNRPVVLRCECDSGNGRHVHYICYLQVIAQHGKCLYCQKELTSYTPAQCRITSFEEPAAILRSLHYSARHLSQSHSMA